ncbi:TonB-dependent receptor [Sphingobacterium populi]|uniref:TonB-dependent receptor domain-containing protein n=1 Tax=Sphingobacterium populi TaxID=1812824 RepID=A0ABW5U8B5_9SPHI
MLRIFFALYTLLLFTAVAQAQNRVTLSGFVKNAESGETMIGAMIRFPDLDISASTNSYGFFSIQVPVGTHRVEVSYVGYSTLSSTVELNKNVQRSFEISNAEKEIEEIVVSASSRPNQVRSPQMGAVKITTEEIKKVPVIFGEPDILKTIQLLPGVATGNEGSSNFFVRGGGGDQNLILLDEAIVYNASHLLGFFSTFNSDAIKDVNLFKGGIPAQYGGRISSVLDINMLDGNKKEFGVEGGVGLIASRLKIDGPIVKDKSSFMVSGRRTYADLFLKLSNDENINQSKLYFYDLNAKMNYKINDRNTLYLSGYFGKDDLGYSDRFSFDWGNATATLRWNSILNEKLFSNTSLIYSDFTYNVRVNSNDNDFGIASQIKNWNLKQDFTYYGLNRHSIRFGVNVLNQKISPASLNAADNSTVNSISVDTRQGYESAIYASDEWKVSDRFSMIYGLRLTNFTVMGPGTFYEFDSDGEAIGEKQYGREVVKNYLNLEPRLSMSYQLNRNNSIKASYNRIVQHLHQLTNTTSSLPTDQYVISSMNIKPQIADQVSLGYFQNFANNGYEFSTEIYYKDMQNQIDFRNGADLQANNQLEGDLLFGKGRAYGIEWLLRKNRGKLNGWISYTLAKSERQFDQINGGEWFNARQDRTHDISIVAMYELSKRWTAGATFVYNTGNAITFPSGKYQLDGSTRFYYTERNGYRMPDYHRLDLSVVYEPTPEKKRFRSSWAFGVYNAYNRRNAYIIDFRENEVNPNITEAYRIALFGAIPSVTWNFKF